MTGIATLRLQSFFSGPEKRAKRHYPSTREDFKHQGSIYNATRGCDFAGWSFPESGAWELVLRRSSEIL
jgi:hypothetical protein